MLFTEQQDAFRESVRRLGDSELVAGYLERAREEKYPTDAAAKLAKNGLLSLAIPSDLGGEGADAVSVGIAVEEIARADFNLALVVCNAALIGGLVARNLAEPARSRWLTAISNGSCFPAIALTEPQSGSDAASLRLQAAECSGGWTLSGEKTSITGGMHAGCALVVAAVKASEGRREMACFLVNLLQDTVTKQPFRDPGWRPIGRASLCFEGTFVPRDALVGGMGQGLRVILREFDYSRPLLALIALGAAQRAIEMTVRYALDRKAFGRAISQYQGVSLLLAEHASYVEALRALSYRTLALRDAGRRSSSEAAMVKWLGPQVAARAINDCIVMHGHVGWSDDLPLQQMLVDVGGLQIGDGTPQIQKLVIAREMFGRDNV